MDFEEKGEKARDQFPCLLNYKMQNINNLKVIVLNISNSCYVKCKYCPNGHNIHHEHLFLEDKKIITKLCDYMEEIDYHNELSITGFGEPITNYLCMDICRYIKKRMENRIKYKFITSGIDFDGFNKDKIKELVDLFGNDVVELTVHNQEFYFNQESYYDILDFHMKGVKIRNHDTNNSNNTLKANNRGGALYVPKNKRCRACYYPFYEICIDTNGDYICCAHNWLRTGYYNNIMDMSIKEHFCNYLDIYREVLYKDNIKDISPCKDCNTDGKLIGEEEMTEWVKLNKKGETDK